MIRMAYQEGQLAIPDAHGAIPAMVGEVTGMSNEEQAEAFTWRALQKTLSDGRVRIRVIGTCDRPVLPLRANLSLIHI